MREILAIGGFVGVVMFCGGAVAKLYGMPAGLITMAVLVLGAGWLTRDN